MGEETRSDPLGHTETRWTHAACILLIVAAIVAIFWRVLLLSETLVDVDTLNNQLPWGFSASATGYPYDRRDLSDTHVTRDYFVVAAYRDGEMPLWNPYTMACHPFYADRATWTLSPFLLLYGFFDVPLGYSVARVTELLLAAVFMYLFMIRVGAGSLGALTGSIVFSMSTHAMLHATGLGWWGGLMWLPLEMLFKSRAVQRESVAQAPRLATGKESTTPCAASSATCARAVTCPNHRFHTPVPTLRDPSRLTSTRTTNCAAYSKRLRSSRQPAHSSSP